jgi:hypothetical protein
VIIGSVTGAELRVRRAAAQLLHRPAGLAPAGIVTALLAVQAQDPRAARLALRARGAGLTAAGVDAALTDERSVVVAWLARGTLHLVAREDYAWLLGLTAPRRAAGGARRLAQEGVSPGDADRAVTVVERALAAEGPLTRRELAERLAAAGIRAEGQATPHLLGLAARRGIAVLGPVRGGEPAFALTRDWLEIAPPAPLTGDARAAALAELARRYLRGHGPATAADLAAWAGLPLRDARAGLGAIAGELAAAGSDGLVDLAARAAADGPAPPRLLGAFDPYLLGWKDRGFAVAPEHARRVHPGGGMLRAVATVAGEAVGLWRARRRGAGRAVDIEPFAPLAAEVAAALEADAADVARFMGGEEMSP